MHIITENLIWHIKKNTSSLSVHVELNNSGAHLNNKAAATKDMKPDAYLQLHKFYDYAFNNLTDKEEDKEPNNFCFIKAWLKCSMTQWLTTEKPHAMTHKSSHRTATKAKSRNRVFSNCV